MFLRISSASLAMVLLASCSAESVVREGETIECAMGTGAVLAEVCSLERVSEREFVIHRPDGGFRLFRIEAGDEWSVVTADGAAGPVFERAENETGLLELALEQERYRFHGDLIDFWRR